MTKLPICLVIGIDGKNPEDIIRGIIGNLPSPTIEENGFSLYQWNITNKYYDASIHLCKILTKTVVDEEFSENVNAIIIYYDSLKENCLNHVDEWIPFLGMFNSGVKILVCEQCSVENSSKPIPKINAQQWCIRHGFELVELDPLDKPDPDDDFPETLGIERIIQALHAHSWPNLELKSGEKSRMDQLSRMLVNDNHDDNLSRSNMEADNPRTDSIVDRHMSEGIDSFEELFQAMSLMKSQASNLEGAERKAYAEKITMAFWHAIDGNPEEIQGINSSEDEN